MAPSIKYQQIAIDGIQRRSYKHLAIRMAYSALLRSVRGENFPVMGAGLYCVTLDRVPTGKESGRLCLLRHNELTVKRLFT